MKFERIMKQVSSYYTEKFQTYGPSPKGVDWNSTQSQCLRFEQLLRIIRQPHKHFSILDYGCGFGSLYEFMKANYYDFEFTGYDITMLMIERAKELYSAPNARWESSLDEINKHDYVIASGIFNVKLDNPEQEWEQYMIYTLDVLDSYSQEGFAFNALSKYSDVEYMKEYLYYADPANLLDYCKKQFSKYVAILHDYPLYEFTILVRKNI